MSKTASLFSIILFSILYTIQPSTLNAAIIYSNSMYQSPVRGEPGDLLFLPGSGFQKGDKVVYMALGDTTKPLSPPLVIPEKSDSIFGIAKVVSYANVPHSLTVLLPECLYQNHSYALWTIDSQGRWSNGVKINDARPLWITPAQVKETSTTGSLPRYIKVVGRNLQPAAGQATQIRLVGFQNRIVTLQAENDGDPATTIEHYVAKAYLPEKIPPGDYRVQLCRDGVSWIELAGQTLTILPESPPRSEIQVSAFGCMPDDGKDDTACIKRAIQHANNLGNGAIVKFSPGVWELGENSGSSSGNGILVPLGVSLIGSGADSTTLAKKISWGNGVKHRMLNPVFTLEGQNQVKGITFRDEQVYGSNDSGSSILQLGKIWYTVSATDQINVRDVVIIENRFDKPFIAITGGGLPIERLIVAHNEIGAFHTGIFIDGDANNLDTKFHFDDSIIAFNIFKPGSYMDVAIRQGSIATQIGASRRLDFSDNHADGTSTQYLYQPSLDPKGWRAAFFWHLRNNQEKLLVSNNRACCTGDKTGDGEAFAFDNNHNSFGFDKVQQVVFATKDSVVVQIPFNQLQRGKKVPSDYYGEHWVQVTEGQGVGQVRRISSYNFQNSVLKINIDPSWDVMPDKSSRLAVGREFWQLYVVDNVVEHGKPTCQKSNRQDKPSTPAGGGGIVLWAQTTDSSIEGNRQYDTNGILLNAAYSGVDTECPKCTSWSRLQYFIEIRGNIVDREYDWDSDCSWSGIMVAYGASPTPNAPPPILSYGLTIAKNTIYKADGLDGGGISLSPSWWNGPAPYSWNLINNTLIFKNTVRGMDGSSPKKVCRSGPIQRTGINLSAATVRNTILHGNDFDLEEAKYIKDNGVGTIKVLPAKQINPVNKF